MGWPQKDLTKEPPFGDLTVVAKGEKGKYGQLWVCECSCGKTTTAYAAKLVNGHKTSCGCKKSERARGLHRRGKAHPKYAGHGDISGSIWHRIVATAKAREIVFDLTIEEAWEQFEKQGGRCAMTGLPLYFAKSSAELVAGLNTASLDRRDSRFGYSKQNVQWVHTVVNQMKWNHSEEDFVAWCKLVVRHARRKT